MTDFTPLEGTNRYDIKGVSVTVTNGVVSFTDLATVDVDEKAFGDFLDEYLKDRLDQHDRARREEMLPSNTTITNKCIDIRKAVAKKFPQERLEVFEDLTNSLIYVRTAETDVIDLACFNGFDSVNSITFALVKRLRKAYS